MRVNKWAAVETGLGDLAAAALAALPAPAGRRATRGRDDRPASTALPCHEALSSLGSPTVRHAHEEPGIEAAQEHRVDMSEVVRILVMPRFSLRSKPASVGSWAVVSCVVAAVILVILILTAGRQLEPPKAWKHSFTTAAALLAAIGSALQAVKARQKARHHEAESRTRKRQMS